MIRIVLLGGSGFVGSCFSTAIAARNFRLLSVSRADCNIYDTNQLVNQLRNLRPDALINCSGYTGKPNVDACEDDKANCLAGNAVLPGVIAKACADLDIPWGHVSSGCIYTGRRADGAGFSEEDLPNFSFRQNNCSFYSGTKALGEEVLTAAEKCYIWRLRIPFNHIDGPRNYLTKVMSYSRLLEAENSLSQLDEFANAALDCIEKRLPYGTYNLTNPGSVTTRQVVNLIRESGICEKDFQFFDSEDEFMQLAARTPRSNCVLDSSKAIAAGLKLTPVEEAIRQALRCWETATVG